MKFRLPQVGDTRQRRVFLLIPRYDANIKKHRWLEWATVKERLHEYQNLEGWSFKSWDIVEFEDTK